MHIVSGNSINETIYKAFDLIKKEGQPSPSRNNGSVAIYNTTFQIENPRLRHLSLIGRSSNIFAMIAETFWVMSGSDILNPYLTFFLPRAPQYSDDGETWHGAYGRRIYANDQIQGVLNTFKYDGKMTRRAQIGIYNYQYDAPQAIAETYGEDHKPKDIPCNSMIYFYITPDDKFHAHVTQRSGDMLFGSGSINPFEFTFLQELMFNEVKKLYPEITLGAYSWYVNNAHVYDAFAKQPEEVLTTHQPKLDPAVTPMIGPDIDKWEQFFGELVAYFSYLITLEAEDEKYFNSMRYIWDIFTEYNVPTDKNILWTYAALVCKYIHSTKFDKEQTSEFISWSLPMEEELKYALINSKFRKFKIV